MDSMIKIEKNQEGIIEQLPTLRNKHFCDVRIQASDTVITQKIQEKLQTLTRISFTKKSIQIPTVQYCHRLVLAAAANDFLTTILKSHDYEDVLILMPDYSKSELDTFLSFVYGQSQEIDLSLPICQLFLKKDMKAIFAKNEFDAKEEFSDEENEVKEKVEVSDDEYVPDIPDDVDIDYEITDIREDEEDVPLVTKKRKAQDKSEKTSSKKTKKDDPKKIKVIDETKEKEALVKTDNPKKTRRNRVKEAQFKALTEAIGNPVIFPNDVNPTVLIKEEPVWKCQFCDDLEKAKFSEYVKHFEEVHQDLQHRATCERCGNNYEAKEDLLVHYLNIPCVGDKDPFVSCEYCPCKFYSFRNLQSHVFLQHTQSCKANLAENWCLYFCEVCSKMFQSIDRLRTHQFAQHGLAIENFADKIESELQFSRKRVNTDMMEVKEKLTSMLIFCRICKSPQTMFESRNDYRNHFAKEHPNEKTGAFNKHIGYTCGPNFKEFQDGVYCICYICEAPFNDRSGFQKHVKDMHEKDEKFLCKRCNEYFPTKLVIIRHKKICEKNSRTVPCEKCDFKAVSISRLRSHMTTDHPENPDERNKKRKIHEKVKMENGKMGYKCDLCEAILNSNKNVYHHRQVVHGLVENDAKPLNCPHEGCKYTTMFRMNLNNHTSRAHRTSRPICEQCGFVAIGAKELRHHIMRNHVNEQHVCDECGKMFTNPLSLYNHKKTHGPPAYVCQECGKAFVRPQQLSTHRKFTHSDFRGFICLCTKAFKSKSHLLRHWKEKGHTKGTKINLKGEVEHIEQPKVPDKSRRVIIPNPKNVVETILPDDIDSD